MNVNERKKRRSLLSGIDHHVDSVSIGLRKSVNYVKRMNCQLQSIQYHSQL